MPLTAVLRQTVLFAVLLGLAACGFTPVHGERSEARDAALHAIDVPMLLGRQGQVLSIALQDVLNPTGQRTAPEYRLQLVPMIQEIPVGLQANQFVSRTNLRLSAQVQLVRVADNATVLNTRVWRNASYGALSDNADFANYVAREDAIKRGYEALAEDIATRVMASLAAQ